MDTFLKTTESNIWNEIDPFRLDWPGIFRLLPQALDIPLIDTICRCLLLKMSRAHSSERFSAYRSDMSAYGCENWRNLSTTHFCIRWINKWFCLGGIDLSSRVQDMCFAQLELWVVYNQLCLGNLVHEKMGWVCRRVSLLSQAAISTQVFWKQEAESLKVSDLHAICRHNLYKLRIKELQPKSANSLYHVSYTRRKRYHVCVLDWI